VSVVELWALEVLVVFAWWRHVLQKLPSPPWHVVRDVEHPQFQQSHKVLRRRRQKAKVRQASGTKALNGDPPYNKRTLLSQWSDSKGSSSVSSPPPLAPPTFRSESLE
jgi:hypothetical protein